MQREPLVNYTAAMAPFLAHGSWSVVIAGRRHEGRSGRCIVDLYEWKSPIDPDETLRAIKSGLEAYGLTSVDSHPHGLAHLDAAYRIGLHVRIIDSPIDELANEMLAALASGEADLPPDPDLRADLLALRKGTTADGFSIRLADVERYPSFAWPAMQAIRECARLELPKSPIAEDFGHKLMRELVQRNRREYNGGWDATS